LCFDDCGSSSSAIATGNESNLVIVIPDGRCYPEKCRSLE
jgi:hypothetical protein